MWYMTDRLRAGLVRNDQSVANQVDVLVDGQLQLSIVGRTVIDPANPSQDTSLIDGNVQNERATVQRSGNVILANLSDVLTPTDVGDLLVPERTELRLWRGLLHHNRTSEVYPNDRELVPVGTLVVTKVVSTWPTVTISGYDRMWLMNKYRLKTDKTITSGQLITDLLVELITSRMPANRRDTAIPSLPYTTPTLVWDAQDLIGDRLHDLAESVGLQLFCDPMGTFTAIAEPTTDNPPDWVFADGATSITDPWPQDTLSAEDAYNVVVTTGEPQDGSVPVRGEASNQDPSSALYAPAIGEIPYFHTSPLYTTNAQADLGARTILAKLGMSDLVVFATGVIPGLAIGDCLQLSSAHPSGLNLKVLADSFPMPLRDSAPVSVTTRARVTFQ